MGEKIALCIDEPTCSNPLIIGLGGEALEGQDWLEIYICGDEARRSIRDSEELEEVWVASCDDVSAINLAATLKSDRPELVVRLVDFEGGGSLFSRAHTASIDEVMGRRVFVERYNRHKRLAAQQFELAQPVSPVESDASKFDAADTPAATSAMAATSSFATLDLPFAANRPVALVSAVNQPAIQASEASQLVAQASPLVLARTSPGVADIRRRGFVMPVVSGSGGAGKSTMSTLSALLARKMGYRTLLVDYDLQFGDIAVLIGVENPLTIDEALQRPERLERELTRAEGVSLIAAPKRLEIAESVAQAVPELISRVSESFDVIVANTGATWAEQHAALLELSTAVLFLVDQRSSSVRASRHALELCARCGIATGQFQFVLNRCAKNAPLSSLDVSCALQGVQVKELKDGGRDVEDCLAAGAAEELLDSGNELCTSLQRVLEDFLPAVGGEEARLSDSPRGLSIGKRRGRHVGKRKGWGK